MEWRSKNKIIEELKLENEKLYGRISEIKSMPELINGIMEYREKLGLDSEDGKLKEEPLFRNYSIDVIALDDAMETLKGNPDFELFINFLHSEEGFCYTKMYKNGKEQHDFWVGKIHSYRRLITQISYEIKNLADNERKKTA